MFLNPKFLSFFFLSFIILSGSNYVLASPSQQGLNQVEKDYRYGKTLLKKKAFHSAIKYLTAAARKGYEKAQYQLGILYYQRKQYKEARYWLRKSANAGNADAQYHYANTFRFGLGTKKQTKIARRLYQRAAKQGHVNAQFELAKMYQYGLGVKEKPKLARKWYQVAAGKGHKNAGIALKSIKFEKEPPKNIAVANNAHKPQNDSTTSNDIKDKSTQLLSQANNGDPKQQYYLAMRYLQGYEVGRDAKQAVYWLTQAAEKKLPLAEYQLGNLYFKGEFLPQDMTKAIHYFVCAQKQGVIAAKTALSVISSSGYETLVKAESGDGKAQLALAEQYLAKNSETDQATGLRWLQLAIKQSYPPAIYKLGQLHEQGKLFEKSDLEAFKAYTKAAKLNYPEAQFALSRMYKTGHGTTKNLTLSNKWLNRAADAGLSDAQKALEYSEL